MSGSTILITITPPGGTAEDITNSVIFSSASFDSQQNAVPGTFEITIRDRERTRGPYATGSEIQLTVDGILLYGGYVTMISRKFALPADEIPTDARLWVLRGVDYNILFDKRVTIRIHDIPEHAYNLKALPVFHGDDYDGTLVKLFAQNYITPLTGFDVTTEVDNVAYPFNISSPDPDRVGGWKQQGTPWREQMELLAEWSGAVWYISPDKKLHWHSLEDSAAPFEFSDTPTAGQVGMRDVSAQEDASFMANEALVWGGSEWTEGAIFAMSTNTTSVADHNRWQVAEHHFGEDGYKLDTQWRADLITEGHASVVGFNPGLAYPQWSISMTWFAEDVPGAVHARAGQLATLHLSTFGAVTNPITLPIRSINISFIAVSEDGTGHVQFSASLGLQLDDPFSLWGFLRRQVRRRERVGAVAAVTSTTVDSTTYGAFVQLEPTMVTDTLYDLPGGVGYIPGTAMVYVDGVLQSKGTAYTESDPAAGEITFSVAPTGDVWVVCRSA